MSDTDLKHFDPLRVLGCSEAEAADLLGGRHVTADEVEAVALTTYQWWRHLRDPRSYWVTTSQAARLMHVAPLTLRRLLDEDRLPYVVHISGVRLMRRHEIVTLGQREG